MQSRGGAIPVRWSAPEALEHHVLGGRGHAHTGADVDDLDVAGARRAAESGAIGRLEGGGESCDRRHILAAAPRPALLPASANKRFGQMQFLRRESQNAHALEAAQRGLQLGGMAVAIMNCNSVRNRPMPPAPVSAICGRSTSSPALIISATFWPSLVTHGLSRSA